jgi:hypothetical protein
MVPSGEGWGPAIDQWALCALGNRLVGILYGCLRHHTANNEDTAWAHRQITQAA